MVGNLLGKSDFEAESNQGNSQRGEKDSQRSFRKTFSSTFLPRDNMYITRPLLRLNSD